MNNLEKRDATNSEKVAPKIFHIHVDLNDGLTDTNGELLNNSDGFIFVQKIIDELGFYRHDFSGHPDGYEHFEPVIHATKKLYSRDEFNTTWQRLIEISKDFPKLAGYFEGEYIPTDKLFPYKELTSFEKPKFKVIRRPLDSTRGEKFRQTEFHLCLDYNNSDQQVITALLDAGLYGAILEKKDHKIMVLTMQGSVRMIKILMNEVSKYLEKVGGVVRCTLKEEVALTNHRLGGMSVDQLPHVAHQVILES